MLEDQLDKWNQKCQILENQLATLEADNAKL